MRSFVEFENCTAKNQHAHKRLFCTALYFRDVQRIRVIWRELPLARFSQMRNNDATLINNDLGVA
jgi:hypothetical protein